MYMKNGTAMFILSIFLLMGVYSTKPRWSASNREEWRHILSGGPLFSARNGQKSPAIPVLTIHNRHHR